MQVLHEYIDKPVKMHGWKGMFLLLLLTVVLYQHCNALLTNVKKQTPSSITRKFQKGIISGNYPIKIDQ